MGNVEFKDVLPNWAGFAFGLALVTSQFYFYINFTGEGFDREVAMAYIVLPMAFLTYYSLYQHTSGAKPLDDLKPLPMLVNGFIGFMLTWALVLFILGYGVGMTFGSIAQPLVLGTIITQVVFVACSEEICFRYVLPSYLRQKWSGRVWYIPSLVSALMFSLFHNAAYGGAVNSLVIAFIIGFLWVLAYEWKPFGKTKLGLGFTIGSHAAYNLCIVGVLTGGITLVTGG